MRQTEGQTAEQKLKHTKQIKPSGRIPAWIKQWRGIKEGTLGGRCSGRPRKLRSLDLLEEALASGNLNLKSGLIALS